METSTIQHLDVSAWPILRLDQLALFSSEEISRSMEELENVLSSDIDPDGEPSEEGTAPSSGSSGGVGTYVARQMTAMRSLLVQRAAQARIQRLLTGEEADRDDCTCGGNELSSVPANSASHSLFPPNSSREDRRGTAGQGPEAKEKRVLDVTLTSGAWVSAGSTAPQDVKRAVLLASQQASFGSMYMVTSVERKRRILPPSWRAADLPSRDEITNAERLARRKAAMARLMARKKRRDLMQQKCEAQVQRKREEEARRQARARAERRTPEHEPEPFDDSSSSGSESLSDVDASYEPSPSEAAFLATYSPPEDGASYHAVTAEAPAAASGTAAAEEGGASSRCDGDSRDHQGDSGLRAEIMSQTISPTPRDTRDTAIRADLSAAEAKNSEEYVDVKGSDRTAPSVRTSSTSPCEVKALPVVPSHTVVHDGLTVVYDGTGNAEGEAVRRSSGLAAEDGVKEVSSAAEESIEGTAGAESHLTGVRQFKDNSEYLVSTDTRRPSIYRPLAKTLSRQHTEGDAASTGSGAGTALAGADRLCDKLGDASSPRLRIAGEPQPSLELEQQYSSDVRKEKSSRVHAVHHAESRSVSRRVAPAPSTATVLPLQDTAAKVVGQDPGPVPGGVVYEHIGAMFPHSMGVRGSCNLRNLLESMQVQLRLYEEWLEVMDDYATVFSAAPAGVDEDEPRNEDEEDGSGVDRNALVYGGKGNSAKALHYRVKSVREDVCNIVTDVLGAGAMADRWVELPAGLGLASWNLLWTWSKPKLNYAQLLVWQRYNHFHGSRQLTQKDLLKRNLQRYTDSKSRAARTFEIMPLTFVLPHEYNQFVNAFIDHNDGAAANADAAAKEDAPNLNIWIMKPIGLSRGRGIRLVRDIADLSYSQASVIQKYVERPLCLHGFKFDLRLYVLVTSFRPLEAFIYREGFARLSFQRYSLDAKDTTNRFIHLTNSSIQKQSAAGPSEDNPVSSVDGGGSKIALQGMEGLWARLAGAGMDTADLWRRICLLVLKSLVAVDDQMGFQPCAFEVFGYDVLIDEALRPWLLEVNSSPSMARENRLDKLVKDAMIQDTIELLDVAPFDRAALVNMLRRRLAELSRNKYSLPRNDPDMAADVKALLGDFVPRRYGELPRALGGYERLGPHTDMYDEVVRLRNRIMRPTATTTD